MEARVRERLTIRPSRRSRRDLIHSARWWRVDQEFSATSKLSQVYGPDQTAGGLTHKPPSQRWSRCLSRERARLQRYATSPEPLTAGMCPIEQAEGPKIGLSILSR